MRRTSPGPYRLPLVMAALAIILVPVRLPAQTSGTGGAVVPTQPSVDQAKRVSNAWQDSDLKQALSDLGLAAGTTVVPDETVQGNVTATIKNKTIEEALDILLLPGGYSWARVGETYLVGKADAASPNFLRFAVTRIYKPNFATAEKIAQLLPKAMMPYVTTALGERTITITAPRLMMERIMQDIKMLDSPLQRVVLEAMVTEADTSTLNQYDMSFTWRNFSLSDSTASPSSAWQYTKAVQSDVANLTALINKGKATIKASPRIMTLDGKEASIEVGQENYFEVISGPVSYPVATIQLIKTGITLKMTPYVSDDGWITVNLSPEISDATGSGTNGLPINTVRKASTTVRVREGETIIIGGMTFEQKRRSDNKVPILGDLPFVGSLFRFHSDLKTKQDVIIMITPKIVRDDDSTADIAEPLSKLPDTVTRTLTKLENGKVGPVVVVPVVPDKPVTPIVEVPVKPVTTDVDTT
ncbi:MAG: hypothetical protein P4L46_26295, partial [Fimbriimonas sp.]|nr:hypothetical protein [Fimbriimonas sp.]